MRKLSPFIILGILISTGPIQPATAAVQIRVFAASSLTNAYIEIAHKFQASHPNVKIVYSFLGSPTLATQIKSGAQVDIFVSASPNDMQGIAVGSNYLTNQIVLGIRKDSEITKISDLNSNVKWIQCAHEVPCGMATDSALASEGVMSKPVSLEPRVTSAVAKLLTNEVDAAFVYKTDVLAHSSQLRAIALRNKAKATTQYQIALLTKSYWASKYLMYLKSKSTFTLLHTRGFDKP